MNKMRPTHLHPPREDASRGARVIPRGRSANAPGVDLKIPPPRINDIVREQRAVTPDTALRFSRSFGHYPQA